MFCFLILGSTLSCEERNEACEAMSYSEERKPSCCLVFHINFRSELWNERRKALGFSEKSNSEFADALHHRVTKKITIFTETKMHLVLPLSMKG